MEIYLIEIRELITAAPGGGASTGGGVTVEGVTVEGATVEGAAVEVEEAGRRLGVQTSSSCRVQLQQQPLQIFDL